MNLFLAFLQPRFDPSLQDDLLADELEEGEEASTSPLPSQRDDEFRPFVRRLPEWQFWCVSSRLCTFRTAANRGDKAVRNARHRLRAVRVVFRDVRRPRVLAHPGRLLLRPLRAHHAPANTVRITPWVIYVRRRQHAKIRRDHRHMIKYKYVPFDLGRKARYGGHR